jgi:hypothetical protein
MVDFCLLLVQYVSYERPALSKAYLFPESARRSGHPILQLKTLLAFHMVLSRGPVSPDPCNRSA